MERQFVVIGNVDNGKSTLGARLLVDSGSIAESDVEKAKREAEKNKKNSFWLAYLLDIDDEERNRGITLGYTTFDFSYKDVQMKLIDVPGHKDLVQEMVVGASFANMAILVLSARQGEYESSLKGQAMEHTLIARGLGISTLIVAINKIDESNDDDIEKIIKDFSTKVKKYKFKTVEFVPVSAYHGTNIKKLLDTLVTVKIENPKDKIVELNKSEKKILHTKFMFDKIPTLITAGFKCICHSKDTYFNVEIVDVSNDKFKYVAQTNYLDKNGLPKLIDVMIEVLDDIDSVSANLIIRYQDHTIGLARIV